jgi:hypothetical protein
LDFFAPLLLAHIEHYHLSLATVAWPYSSMPELTTWHLDIPYCALLFCKLITKCWGPLWKVKSEINLNYPGLAKLWLPAGTILGSAMDSRRFEGQASSLWPSCTMRSGRSSALTSWGLRRLQALPASILAPLPSGQTHAHAQLQWGCKPLQKACMYGATTRCKLQGARRACMQPSSTSSSSSSSPEAPRRSEDARGASPHPPKLQTLQISLTLGPHKIVMLAN